MDNYVEMMNLRTQVSSLTRERDMLKDQLMKVDEILTKVDNEPKRIAKIKSGPHTSEDGSQYFRVDAQGFEGVLKYVKSFGFGKAGDIDKIEPGMDVVFMGGSITGVLPNELADSLIEKPKFKLISWDEVGGLKSQIQQIRETIETPLANAAIAREIGEMPIKGAILYGPPGCGKTLVAKAIASSILKSTEVDPRAFTYVKGGELLNKFIGATEQRIMEIFKAARNYIKETGKTAIVFIDEAEAIMPIRGSRLSSDAEKTIVPTFLAEMDGFEGGNPFVLLATNHINSIDSAIIREGRIDLRIEIRRPSESDLADIFKIHLKRVKCAEDLEAIAQEGSDLLFKNVYAKERISGGLAETMVKLAAKKAVIRISKNNDSPRGVTKEDIKQAVHTIK